MDCSLLPDSMLKLFQERIMEYPDQSNGQEHPQSPPPQKKREKKTESRVIDVSESNEDDASEEVKDEFDYNIFKGYRLGKEPPKT